MCTTDTPAHLNDLGLSDKNDSCCCAGSNHQEQAAVAISADVRASEFLVSGMTCAHCVSNVSDEVGAVAGVESVSVELNVGGASKITVEHRGELDRAVVAEAIDEAGYSLVSA